MIWLCSAFTASSTVRVVMGAVSVSAASSTVRFVSNAESASVAVCTTSLATDAGAVAMKLKELHPVAANTTATTATTSIRCPSARTFMSMSSQHLQYGALEQG